MPAKPYNVPVVGVVAYGLIHPNGTSTFFQIDFEDHEHATPSDQPKFGWSPIGMRFGDFVGTGASATWVQGGGVYCYPTFGGSAFTVLMNDLSRPATGPVPTIAGSYGAIWKKEYDLTTQNLLREAHRTYSASPRAGVLLAARNLPGPSWVAEQTETTKAYNFLGQPLTAKTVESVFEDNPNDQNPYPVQTDTRTATVQYAYWGADKYFQQKAAMDQAGRFSYTDYHPNTADPGFRGQTYRVHDPKYGGLVATASTDPAYAVPQYALPGTKWRRVTGTSGATGSDG